MGKGSRIPSDLKAVLKKLSAKVHEFNMRFRHKRWALATTTALAYHRVWSPRWHPRHESSSTITHIPECLSSKHHVHHSHKEKYFVCMCRTVSNSYCVFVPLPHVAKFSLRHWIFVEDKFVEFASIIELCRFIQCSFKHSISMTNYFLFSIFFFENFRIQ